MNAPARKHVPGTHYAALYAFALAGAMLSNFVVHHRFEFAGTIGGALALWAIPAVVMRFSSSALAGWITAVIWLGLAILGGVTQTS